MVTDKLEESPAASLVSLFFIKFLHHLADIG